MIPEQLALPAEDRPPRARLAGGPRPGAGDAALPRMSPNLALNQLVARRQAAGEQIVHLGLGEARLPVFGPLAQRLAAGADRNCYGPVAGELAVRREIAGYFSRRRMPTGADQVIVGPGSKPLLLALQSVIGGDLVVPRPCWVTYSPQGRLAGKDVIGVPVPEQWGGIPEPAALSTALQAARARGANPRILVLTLPDNPTGTLAPGPVVADVCRIAEEEDLAIISDEIYRDLIHHPDTPMTSPAELAPGRTVVVTGLSKSLALGGWRIGAARFPASPWGGRVLDGVIAFASEAWSALAGPMQEVAAYAFAEPPELRERLAADVRLHAAVAGRVHEILRAAGTRCRPPAAAFYVYPDLEPLRSRLAPLGIHDSVSLQRVLIDRFGLAVLGGLHFGDDPGALRFRAATSMLYGATRGEQAAALEAGDPLSVPHIRAVIARIETAMAALASP